MNNLLPTISIIIPTLNSAKILGDCLKSIDAQNYSKEKVEIIIADAGSIDGTLDIAKKYTNKILPNPLKTGEAGKAVGVKATKNEIIALIDSDNILPCDDWLKRMVEPFEDKEIIASEPIEYTYRKEDGFITRYCALMGMNDPLCYFLGNYDRINLITKKWTEIPVIEEDKGSYYRITLNEKKLPTIGANGFLVRREILLDCSIDDYLFDIDAVYEMILKGKNKIAKVKTGIIHLFSGNIRTFIKKQQRRVKDYLYYNKLGVRKYPWGELEKLKLLKFILACFLIIPLFHQSILGYTQKRDKAWFFHPLACWITLLVYGWGRISGIFGVKELGREGWKQ
jgi:glycosyltransferase involved in cell wall biosynthesis